MKAALLAFGLLAACGGTLSPFDAGTGDDAGAIDSATFDASPDAGDAFADVTDAAADSSAFGVTCDKPGDHKACTPDSTRNAWVRNACPLRRF